MSKFNKSYRIRTEVGKDTQVHVNLDRDYDILEIMSLSIDQKNAYKFHTSNYGVIAGRVLANDAFGIPNAKVSVFIKVTDNDVLDSVKSVLYPYNTTQSKDAKGVKYNLFPNEQLNDCHTIIGTFPEKQYMLDNDNLLEIFEDYYKFTTRTNNAGDYMIFGVPTGNQTIHVDIDLSDIGILSQKPRDLQYKGYNIESFENANKFKYDTNLESLVQVISQDAITEVIPFWGENSESSVGITRCDIQIQYKFEPTCVFMGSVVSDTNSNGISKKCIPTPGMGSMEEIVTGSGTIEMIRKTPSGDVEEFQIKGNQLINGNGVWCYQIPMNLDYMMTDEFGNMVPTNHPEKGIPTRTRVRFRLSLDAFENDDENMARGKMLIPHNPNIYGENIDCQNEIDYQFGTKTQELSYRDLYWNGVYSVKSYIPRLQRGSNDKNEDFTGFKRVNYYGDKNPIPYNNIRIRIPYMFTVICILIKSFVRICKFLNRCFRLVGGSFISIKNENDEKKSGSFITLSGELCNNNLDWLCFTPGVDIEKIVDKHRKENGKYVDQNIENVQWRDNIGTDKKPVYVRKNKKRLKTLLTNALLNHYEEMGGDISPLSDKWDEENKSIVDKESIDYKNYYEHGEIDNLEEVVQDEVLKLTTETIVSTRKGNKKNNKTRVTWGGLKVTDDTSYLIKCIEMNLAKEYKVIQFDFYNDWINGVVYIPRWMRNISKKRTYIFKDWTVNSNIEACNEARGRSINLVQQCALTYYNDTNKGLMQIFNNVGCNSNIDKEPNSGLEKLECHKHKNVRKAYRTFKNTGLVHQVETLKKNYVYYFKPVDSSNEKNIRLFATDIILLGTLNSCDRWGLPSDFRELSSTTYQMPTNLALTDSVYEGEDYEAKFLGSTEYIGHDGIKRPSYAIEALIVNKDSVTEELYLRDAYTKINPIEEDANFTEMSGISWNYTGPLQSLSNTEAKYALNNRKSYLYRLYNPGGHFLGLSCRSSETNIKTCVNLSRICEHGVWMSQRQELKIPKSNASNINEAFENYAIVPSGLISKDEISDTNYRRLFATMNKNKLKTRINPETGYPIYDFEYVNPTNFNGELSYHLDKVNYSSNTNNIFVYNRTVGKIDTEKNYDYDDYEKYSWESEISKQEKKKVEKITPETEIMRTGEFLDTEYLKYRFGLNDEDIVYDDKKPFIKPDVIDKHFLFYDKEANRMSFPIYDNSFYFYFGLKEGDTAIDEFKKLYYANCGKADLFTVEKNDIELLGEKIIYDGFKDIVDEYGNKKENTGSGCILFSSVIASDAVFTGGKTKLLLYNVDDENPKLIKEYELKENKKEIKFEKLKAGEYKLIIENKDFNIHIEKEYTIKNVTLNIPAQAFNFYSNVAKETLYNKFMTGFKDDDENDKLREDYGGYIIVHDDELIYNTSEDNNELINLYDSSLLYKYKVIGTYKDSSNNDVDIEINSITDYRYSVTTRINNNDVTITLKEDDISPYSNMIPVPKENVTYYLQVYAALNDDNKLDKNITGNSNVYLVATSGPLNINNGSTITLYYNDVSYTSEIMPHLTENETKEYEEDYKTQDEILMSLIDGWWNKAGNNDKLSWEDSGDDNTIWKIKEALYMSHVNEPTKPHVVNLKLFGGVPPYEEYLTGHNNVGVLLSYKDNNMSELSNIQLPTLNYYNENIQKRFNFLYFSYDSNGFDSTILNGFVFPVIYKPFFTEMLLCNYSDKGIYLCGNVYNGKTWYNKTNDRYEFNVFSFNNQSLFPISTKVSDTKFELDEITNDGERVTGVGICDSWNDNETKKYCKYNGRKITVIHALTTPDIFNINVNNDYISGDLKIGTNLNIDESLYIDETSISNNSLALFKFSNEYKLVDNELHLRKIIDSNKAIVYLIKDNEYPYPMDNNGNPKITNTKLFRNIIDNSISGASVYNNDYIDLSKYEDNNNLYWVALPKERDENGISKSIKDNVLKSVTISDIVNIKDLKSFYPLNLDKNNCITMIGNDNNTVITIINLSCNDNKSKENMSGKTFMITFYDSLDGENELFTINIKPDEGIKQIYYQFKSYERELLGFYNNNKPQVIYFNYKTKMIKDNVEIISPLSYGIRGVGVKYQDEEVA